MSKGRKLGYLFISSFHCRNSWVLALTQNGWSLDHFFLAVICFGSVQPSSSQNVSYTDSLTISFITDSHFYLSACKLLIFSSFYLPHPYGTSYYILECTLVRNWISEESRIRTRHNRNVPSGDLTAATSTLAYLKNS